MEIIGIITWIIALSLLLVHQINNKVEFNLTNLTIVSAFICLFVLTGIFL